jgi:cation transport ATPase
MNHQPFRDWLLSDEQLSEREQQALQSHLSTCEACSQIESAWKEIELEIKRSPQVTPAPGFTDRWQANLSAYQVRRQSRGGWFTISATSVIVTALFGVMAWQVWLMLQSPQAFLDVWLNRMVSVISLFFVAETFFSSSIRFLTLYTILGMVFLVGLISFMSVLWLAAYRKLSFARRVE